ncbi:D-methionine transport system substrate-binding protein [Peptoniphilus ivorii]|uniref:MetQ/NlpA family ABC transporter substrate-binding protein n=1 Tax=Aedoeadaptatus ivorii TaxID=54006 RepID=UPI00277EFFA7|nr:MetQ/NlpA family ABC transporter substrate-binding protein [Peptoniphilus ivorii]MDQ0508873.1 D-methionine transport system substrate-binding protein [Peptoniphilus ivorii]
MKKLFTAAALLAVMIAAVGCTKADTGAGAEDKELIRIGGTSVSQIYYEACKDDFEKKGYKTEFVPFDANPVVLEACNSGDVDISIGQHLKFVESFNANKSGDLTMAKPYVFHTGIGLYSEKYDAVDKIPDGAKIAVMNDPMNEDIAMRILEENGLVELKEGKDLYTKADVTNNPKNIEIVEMEQAQTVTALQDLDAACVFFTHMASAGKDPSTYLARDTVMIRYPMGVIVKKENEAAQWAVDFAESMRTDASQKKIEEEFPGVFTFYTSDDEAK